MNPFWPRTQDILDGFKKRKGSWEIYTAAYLSLIQSRKGGRVGPLKKIVFLRKTVLLCSEATAEHCHRRLALEYLQQQWGSVEIHHL